MEWSKIPTDLLVQGLTDNEMIAIVKYQSLWALLERQPDDKIALKHLTNKQLMIAKSWQDSIKKSVTSDIDSINKKRRRDKKSYEKQSVSKKSDGADKIREDKIRLDKIKEKNNNIKKDFLEQFEKWWSECPRKVSKLDAKKSFEKILNEKLATFDELMAGIKRYAQHCREQKTEEQFIKHPSTWLNQGCWSDEPMSNPKDWEDMEWEKL